MAESQFGAPVIIDSNGVVEVLQRESLSGKLSSYDEAFVQNLVFEHPECLPIVEIDRDFLDPIPICVELNTPAGPIDALYLTASGRVVILEAKLWRNPEARRKVVAQILDYAKEFSRWDYEDLQREVSKKLGRKGNVPYELVKEIYPDLDEADFLDAVSKSLKQGKFLLLIVGDGIREGVGAIAEFLQTVGRLEFTFGLVELGIFRSADGRTLIQPRVLV